jgi:hypothetical protein
VGVQAGKPDIFEGELTQAVEGLVDTDLPLLEFG